MRATSPLAALEMSTGVRLFTLARNFAVIFSRVVRGTITAESLPEKYVAVAAPAGRESRYHINSFTGL
jgi:hypothetical protein